MNTLKKIGLNPYEATFLDIVDQFAKTKKSKHYTWTFALKYNLENTIEIIRELLERVFTLICLLDNSFDLSDISSPDQAPPIQESSENDPTWKIGEFVINQNPKSPDCKNKGIIRNIDYETSTGKPKRVFVEYSEEQNQNTTSKGNTSSNIAKFLGQVWEENPDADLALLIKNQPESNKSRKKALSPIVENLFTKIPRILH